MLPGLWNQSSLTCNAEAEAVAAGVEAAGVAVEEVSTGMGAAEAAETVAVAMLGTDGAGAAVGVEETTAGEEAGAGTEAGVEAEDLSGCH